jgi:replication-associated recombination protein RarA
MITEERGSRGRFAPGKSGNAKGRPKAAKTVSAAILTAANQTVMATANGHKRTVGKIDATATQIANKGASGDLRAGKMLLDMAARAEEQQASVAVPETLTRTDQEILDAFLADYRRHLEEGGQ